MMRATGGMLAALVCAGAARAEVVTYLSSSRSVAASCTGNINLADSSALAGVWAGERFAFNPSLDNPSSTPNTSGLSGGGGYGMQSSTLGSSVIGVHLLAKAWDGVSGNGGTASSSLQAVFTLPASTPCQISGSWSTNYTGISGAQPSASWLLTGPGGVVVLSTGYAFPALSGPIVFNGTLPAGQYVLQAMVGYSYGFPANGGGSQFADMNFTLAVPAPAACVPLAMLGAGCLARRSRRTL